MIKQKLFSSQYIGSLQKGVSMESSLDLYTKDVFDYKNIYVLENPQILVPNSFDLEMPEEGNNHDIDNCKVVYNALKNMEPIQATDYRIWVYLTHVASWAYMRMRRPVEDQPKNKREDYVITHWFIDGVSARNLLRNDISSFWWCGYLTYDENRKNPFELTEELYSMLDYTRHLLSGRQGRNKNFVHALLEFVIENKNLFENQKEAKVRLLMRKANYVAGYKVFPSLSKDEIKTIFQKYTDDVKNIPQNSNENETKEDVDLR